MTTVRKVFSDVNELCRIGFVMEKQNLPLKRNEYLRPFSRDHHRSLLLCWKIRRGLNNGIAPHRIMAYTVHHFKNYILPHFEMEEKHIFSLFPRGSELADEAIRQHKHLRELLDDPRDMTTVLKEIGSHLSQHIRFEERKVFPEVERIATASQLRTIANVHMDGEEEIWFDPFWTD